MALAPLTNITTRCAHCGAHVGRYFERRRRYPEGATVLVEYSEDRMSCPQSPTGVHVAKPRDGFRDAILSLAGALSFEAAQAQEAARRVSIEGPHDTGEAQAHRAAAVEKEALSVRLYAILAEDAS